MSHEGQPSIIMLAAAGGQEAKNQAAGEATRQETLQTGL